MSISDTESQLDSFHSPLRSESLLRSDDPYFQTEHDAITTMNNNTKTLVCVEKYYSPVPSPRKFNPPASSAKGWRPWPHSEKPTSENLDFPAKETSPVDLGLNRLLRDAPPPGVGMVGGGGLEDGVVGEGRSDAAVTTILRRWERNVVLRRAALVFS